MPDDPLLNRRAGSNFGVWRSLVAHLHGVQGVGGSNPLTPTILSTCSRHTVTRDYQCVGKFG